MSDLTLVDPPSSWESRRSTSILLGTYVRELRAQHRLDVDVLATCVGEGRTSQWLRSLERGEFIPTYSMLHLLSSAFDEACLVSPRYDLAEVYQGLLDEPGSDLADALRARVLPGTQMSETELEDREVVGLKLYSDGLSQQDRLLGLFPSLLALVLLGLVLASLNEATSQLSVWPGTSLVVAALVFLGSAVAILVPGLRRFLDVLSRPIHVLSGAFGKRKDPQAWAATLGLSLEHAGRWHQPAFNAHITSAHRRPFGDVSVAADFAVRVSTVFLLGGLSAAALAWFKLDLRPSDLMFTSNVESYEPGSWLAVVSVVSIVLGISSAVAAYRRGRSAHGTLFDGLGYVRVSESSPLPDTTTASASSSTAAG